MIRKAFFLAASVGLSCSVLTGCAWDAMTAKAPVQGPCTRDTNESKAAWERFRAANPLHIQGVALSSPFGEGCRTLVIAEPPPNVTLQGLVGVAPALLAHHRTEQHGVGYDGWTKDVVVTLPPIESAKLDELVSELHEHLFGTTYKGYTLDIPAKSQKARAKTVELDVRVTHDELRRWISSEDSYRVVEGGDAVTLDALLTVPRPGVYLSATPGLVAWVLPRREGLDRNTVEARQFLLDSDLVIGAVASDETVLILGRERLAPLDVLPPLRVETLLLLASVGTSELAQSYERQHVLAGRVGKWDWAPIYLSDELYDTEFGSILNITDQLLKSWSNNGETEYWNFAQPSPARWGFDKSLFRMLHERGVNSLVYNWNTSGFGASLDLGRHEILAFRGTAALPVMYLPEANTLHDKDDHALRGYNSYELSGYEFFASQSDPNLVRVAQYTTLYQTFRAFDIRAAAQPRSSTRDAQVAVFERVILAMLKRYRSAVPRELDWARVAELDAEDRQYIMNATAARRSFRDYLQGLDDEGLSSVAAALAMGRGAENQTAQWVMHMATTGELDFDAFVRRGVLVDTYASATKPRNGTWIHTPSGVLSRNRGKDGERIRGGHNIDSKILEFSTDSTASDIGSRRSFVNLGEIDRIRLDPNADPWRPARTVAQALARPPQESGLVRGAPRSQNNGWGPAAIADAKIPTASRSDETVVLVSRDEDGYRIVSSDRHAMRARTSTDARDAALRILRRAEKQNKNVRVILDDFPSTDEARGFSHAIKLRSKADDIMISRGRESVEQWFGHRFDFSKPVLTEGVSADGGWELRFEAISSNGVAQPMSFRAWAKTATALSAKWHARVKELFDKVLRMVWDSRGLATVDAVAKAMREELEAQKSELGDVEFEIVNEFGDALIVRRDPRSPKKASDG